LEDGEKWGTLWWSKAPNTCSFFFIDKKDGKLCPVVNYRPLNEITKKNAAPIPLIPKLVDKLLGVWFFMKLDIRWGYNNVWIHPDDIKKTTFKSPLGLFESLVMTFGLCNTPTTFQTFMDTQFADIITTGHVVIYLDDILIFAETLQELTQLTHQVLQKIQDLDLFLRPTKCSFNQTWVEYLGLIISEGEICMDPVKLKAIQEWPLPWMVKDIQKFLGFCNFYRRFVKDYSHIAQPLFNLTKKETPWNWTTECDMAFETLRQTMITSLVLMLLDHEKPFTLITDASDYTIGAILEQRDALGRSHPIAYFSKSLQPAERNYKIHDKELLAIIHALKHFQHYIHALKHFRHYIQESPHMTRILSDHANLKYFTTKQTLTHWQAWWALFLNEYNYMIIPTPEKQNTADSLSRHPDLKEGIATDNTDRILLTPDKFRIQALQTTAIPMEINTDLKQAIQEAIETDRLTGQKLKDILLNGPHDTAKGLQEWNLEDGLILYKGLVYVPNNENLKHKVVQ
jgi:hypothetical protein